MANTTPDTTQETGQLVIEAEKLIRNYFPSSSDEKQESRGKTQLSNAIDVIKQSDSIEVFINWVRYQMAREKKDDEFWTTSLNRNRPQPEEMFGSAVIQRANQIRRQYEDQHAVAIRRLTEFLGFLRRAFLARNYLHLLDLSEQGGRS
jgi:hypothetical protein